MIEQKLKFLARHFRRANFFVLFQKFFSETGCVLTLQFQISEGINFFEKFGIDINDLRKLKRNFCKVCLDWSERRFHLGGEAGAALFIHLESKGWIQRVAGFREVVVTASGRVAIVRHFTG